jgi:hypothetical protein
MPENVVRATVLPSSAIPDATESKSDEIPAKTVMNSVAKAVSRPRSPLQAATDAKPGSNAATCCGCAWLRNVVLPQVSWEDPIRTGILFTLTLVTFFVFGVLKVSPLAFAGYSFIAAAVVCGLVHGLVTGGLLNPKFSVNWIADSRALEGLPKAASAAVETGLKSAISCGLHVLSWKQPISSLKVRCSGADTLHV